MTLLDAPQYNEKRAKLVRNLSIAALVIVLVGGFCTFWFWNWPAEHRINNFMAVVESGDFAKGFAEWNRDPNWQKHPQQYSAYDFDQFQKDWGPMSEYGKIRSHKLLMAKSVGNGTVVGMVINGDTAHPLFLRVDNKTKTIGFSPVELYVGP
ncbi:hypothetical protein ACPOL_1958 [Acidisarcina polymorpha]|uniref:Uncharacterized protein n=1 Tax=Acidisarcina polymorpha TaxID=2211140 RepID=A0A2Z5FXQ6_9BACT|nr:hypothetical protein [Acidisarcina polymorpha]AXC11294.1 hypothetical protein ACPOL_1958 [Acidisarcina polymorpha]